MISLLVAPPVARRGPPPGALKQMIPILQMIGDGIKEKIPEYGFQHYVYMCVTLLTTVGMWLLQFPNIIYREFSDKRTNSYDKPTL